MTEIPNENYWTPPAGSPTPPPPPGSTYTGPNSNYFYPAPNGVTQRPNAPENFANNNQIDPNTGMFYPGQEGGLVPHQLSLIYQSLSDQGIWRSRQNMMRSGINYARGALGLLQSFRPGGGATLEAGQYNTLAGLEFNRAQLTQPLDLLGDYRREEISTARRQANRAQERDLAVKIAGTVASLAVGGAGGGMLGSLFGGAVGAMNGRNNEGSLPMGAAYPEGQQTQNSYISPGQASGQPMGPSQSPGALGPQSPMSSMGAGGTQQSTLGQGQQAPQTQRPKSMQSGGVPGQEQGSEQGAGENAVGSAMGTGTPTVGADGNFTPVAYAASAAASLPHPIQQLALSRAAATMIENDPFYATLTTAINRRWAQRLTA